MEVVRAINSWWIDGLFSAGLALAITAQVIAYRTGERSRKRRIGMLCGITGIVLVLVAGQIGALKLYDLVNSEELPIAPGAP